MIEFGLKHYHSSGWHKKFPRRKIEKEDFKHLSMTGHLRFRDEWFEGRRGYLSWKDLNKFLEANIGRNVDTVFSEFVRRAKKFKHSSDLKEIFFENFDPLIRYRKGFALDSQNRIIKHEDKSPRPSRIYSWVAEKYNEEHYPKKVNKYLNDWGYTYFGKFYIQINYGYTLVPIYIVNKEWFDFIKNEWYGKPYVKADNMVRVFIPIDKCRACGIGNGGTSKVWIPTGKMKTLPSGFKIELHEDIIAPYSTNKDAPWIFVTPRDSKISYWNIF